MRKRSMPPLLGLTLALAACGQQGPQARNDTVPVTLSLAQLRAASAPALNTQGLPYDLGGTGVREVKVSVTDASGTPVRFNAQNVVDPNGDVSYFVLTPSASAVNVSLLKDTAYTFTSRAFDQAVLNSTRHLLGFGSVSKTFAALSDTGVVLPLRGVLGAGSLSTLPVNMAVPGQTLAYLLGVSANGRGDLRVPADDYSVSYLLANATDTSAADPQRGITVRAASAPTGDLSVTARLSGLVASGQDDAVPGSLDLTATLPFADGLSADLSAPTLQNLSTSAPSANAVTLSGTVQDNWGLATVRVYAGARLLSQLAAGEFTGTTFSARITGLQPGDSLLTVIATDASGNEATAAVNVAPGAQVDPSNLYVNPAVASAGDGSFAAPFQSLSDALAQVAVGGTLHLAAGEYTGNLTLSQRVTLRGPNAGIVGASQARRTEATFTGIVAVLAGAAGTTIDGVEFLTSQHSAAARNMLQLQASNVTVTHSVFEGPALAAGQTWSSSGFVTRGLEIGGSLSGLTVSRNAFTFLRQPAYINPDTTGTVSDNQVTGTRGFVLDGAPMTLTGNRFAQTEGADIALLNRCTNAAFVALSAAELSQANNNALMSDQRGC